MLSSIRALLLAVVVLIIRLVLRAVVWMKIAAHHGFFRVRKALVDPKTASQSTDIALRTCLVLCGSNLWTPHRDIRTVFNQSHRAPPVNKSSKVQGPQGTSVSNDHPSLGGEASSQTPTAAVSSHFLSQLEHPLNYQADVISDSTTYYRITNGPASALLVWFVMPWEIMAQAEQFTTRLASLMDMNLAIIQVKRRSTAEPPTAVRHSQDGHDAQAGGSSSIAPLLSDVWSEVENIVTYRAGTRFFTGGMQLAGSFAALMAQTELSVLESVGTIVVDPFVGWPAPADAQVDGTQTPIRTSGGIVAPQEAGIVDAVLAAVGEEVDVLTQTKIRDWIPSPTQWRRRPTYVLALDEGLWCGQIVNFAMKCSREGSDVKLDLYRTRHFTPSSHGQFGLPVLNVLQKVASWTELLIAHGAGEVSYTPSYLSNLSTPGKPHGFHSMACDDPDYCSSGSGGTASLVSNPELTSMSPLPGPGLRGIKISGDNLSSLQSTPSMRPGLQDVTPPPAFTLAGLPLVASNSSMSDWSQAVTPEAREIRH